MLSSNDRSRTPITGLRPSVAHVAAQFAAASRTVGVMAFVTNGLDATVKPAKTQTIPARTVAKNLLPALIFVMSRATKCIWCVS